MKTIGLFLFSGTGNTERMCSLFREKLEKKGYKVWLRKMEYLQDSSVVVPWDDLDMVGICYPIYGFGTPILIKKWIKSIPLSKGTPLFFLKTAADYIEVNQAASFHQIRILHKKGYNVFYDRILVMPSNWFLQYPPAFSRQLLDVLPDKLDHALEEITQNKIRLYHPGALNIIGTSMVSFFESSLGSRMFGLGLKTSKNCSQCGICEKKCPRGNIRIVKGGIRTGFRCQWCMRCIYSCPEMAIQCRWFKKCVLSAGYSLKQIEENHSLEGNVTGITTGFYKHFYSYLKDLSI